MQEKVKRPTRRESAGRPGVFYRLDENGKRVAGTFEYWFVDSDGKRRWRTVHGKLGDAVAAREKVRTRIRSGERVAPSKVTFGEYADAWIETQSQLRPRTIAAYKTALRVHLKPKLGNRRLGTITADDVAELVADLNRRGYSAWTCHGTLTPLSALMRQAERRGFIAANPVRQLERGERPSVGRTERRVLSRDEIDKLLGKASDLGLRALAATAIFTGLRLGELLGLTWADVDFGAGLIHVRRQLGRDGTRVEPKTPEAVRSVVLMPALGKILREHKLRSDYSKPSHLVFPSRDGKPHDHRNANRRLAGVRELAGLDGSDGRTPFRWHDARHSYASLLIAGGLDVVTVSRQLGHANAAITGRLYAREFEAAEQAARTSALLEDSFGMMLGRYLEEPGTESKVVPLKRESG